MLQLRSTNISFTDNSNIAIDVMVFIYSDEFVVDVEKSILINQVSYYYY